MKIIESYYKDGIATITIQTALGRYTGIAKVHPDDKDIANRFIGWKIAEQRALIKYYKDQIRKEKYKMQGLKELYSVFIDDFDILIEHELLCYQHENHIKNWENQIQKSKQTIKKNLEGITKIKQVIFNKTK